MPHFDFGIPNGQIINTVSPSRFVPALGKVFQKEYPPFNISGIFASYKTPCILKLSCMSHGTLRQTVMITSFKFL